MQLRDIPFSPVSNASGGRNFFGDGYPFHGLWNALTKPLRLFGVRAGLTYEGANFVAKTTTLKARPGNMPLVGDSTKPSELIPKCIVVKPRHMAVLNKVGLSGPGIKRLLDLDRWQRRNEPFFLSFMATGATVSERLRDTEEFLYELVPRLPTFNAPIGMQINVSCPNVKHGEQDGLPDEVGSLLDLYARHMPTTPLVPKFSVELEPAIAAKIARHDALDAMVVSNTIPWGKYPDRIDWKGIFGSDQSPLAHLDGPGGGGLSGAPIFPLTLDWLVKARRAGLKKPIYACGGILSPRNVRMVADAGASGFEAGSVSILCPWNAQPSIDEGRRRFV
jgi:dihydroorotate dehydrogenase